MTAVATYPYICRFDTLAEAEAARPAWEAKCPDKAPMRAVPCRAQLGKFSLEWTPKTDLRLVTAPEPRPPRLAPVSPNRVLRAAEFAGTLMPREHRVKGLLLKDSALNMIYGTWGVGKSFFALDLACAIHRGVPWNGKRTTQGRVVTVAAEGIGDFKYRQAAYAKAHGVDVATLPDTIANAPNLLDKAAVEDVIQQLMAAGPYAVVVIDTMAATAPGNENAAETMGPYLANVSAIGRRTGAQIIVVAHSGKDESKGVRGWSGIGAALDTQLHVTKVGDTCTVEVTKNKGGADGAKFAFTLEFVPLGMDEDGDAYGSCVVRYMEPTPKAQRLEPRGANQKAVYAVIPEVEPIDLAAVLDAALPLIAHDADAAGIKTARGNLRRAYTALKDAGLVHVHDGKVSRSSAVTVDAESFEATP